jgi:beta-aspartyl-peptidase (threonine type)
MEYKGMNLQEAMTEVVMNKLPKLDGEGGMIGVDAQGNVAMVLNSAGMYRGMRNSEGENYVKIYHD